VCTFSNFSNNLEKFNNFDESGKRDGIGGGGGRPLIDKKQTLNLVINRGTLVIFNF
jgi:hypothetical protein